MVLSGSNIMFQKIYFYVSKTKNFQGDVGKEAKKCRVLFEWPLNTIRKEPLHRVLDLMSISSLVKELQDWDWDTKFKITTLIICCSYKARNFLF